MNEFNVKTPDEWKTKLYCQIIEKKTVRLRPAMLVAAIIAFVICISGSAFAVRVSRAPEYFGSKYLGQSESSDQVYSEKNLMLKSDREDLELVCKGIVGDNYNLFLVFELNSTGDVKFDENKHYLFEEADQHLAFSSSFGRGIGCYFVDENTLRFEIFYSGINSGSIVGRILNISFVNIEEYENNSFKLTDTIQCSFKGNIAIDYANTQKKLKKTDSSVEMNSVTFEPLKADITNLNFNYTLKVLNGMDIFESVNHDKLIEGTFTLNYKDGTKETFNINMPPDGANDIGASTMEKRGDKFEVQLHFRQTINASAVASVELNGVEVFVAR